MLLPPPQQLPYRSEAYEPFVLSVNRLDRAKRIDLLLEAAAREPGFRVVVAGDGPDRERLERAGAERPRRVRGPRRRGAAGRALRAAASPSSTRPYDEDYGIVPYEAFMAEKPVMTTTDAGGPLDVVADRRTGLVVEPRADAVAEACTYLLRARGRGARVGAGGSRRRRAAVVARDGRDAGGGRVVKIAYFSPMPPSRSGIADYSALLVPALRERTGVEVVKQGSRKQPRGTDVALYHVGNDPEAHGWIVEALRAHPGVVVLHEFVLHHLIAGLTLGRKDVAQYLAAMERDHGVAGRLLGLGVLDGCVPPLWETRPEDFPLAGEVLDATRGRGVIVHSRYVEERVRACGVRRAGVAHPAPGLARAGGRAGRPGSRPR